MSIHKKIALIIGAILLSACASKEPVQAFSTSAETFLKSFDGFAARAKETCQLKYMHMDLDSTGDYNAKPEDAPYKSECADYDQAYKGLKVYSAVVSTYAGSLGKLAGIEPSVFSDDIDGVSKQVASWETSGGEKAKPETVSAATKLIKAAAETVVGFMVEQRIKDELKNNHENLKLVIDDMKTFALDIQTKHLDRAKKYALTPVKQLLLLSYTPNNEEGTDQFSNIMASGTIAGTPASALGARLPYRISQIELYRQIAAIDQEKKALKSFSESCDALVQAHRDLKDNFGKLNKEEMLKKVKEFYDKVKEARENFIALNS